MSLYTTFHFKHILHGSLRERNRNRQTQRERGRERERERLRDREISSKPIIKSLAAQDIRIFE